MDISSGIIPYFADWLVIHSVNQLRVREYNTCDWRSNTGWEGVGTLWLDVIDCI